MAVVRNKAVEIETEKLENGGNWRRSIGRRSLVLEFLLLSERLNDYHAVINVVFFTKITWYLHCASLSIEFLSCSVEQSVQLFELNVRHARAVLVYVARA